MSGEQHGSTTLQFNGGLYGAIKMEPYDDILNISMYEPQLINDSYDHTIIASFVWLNSADSCDFLFNGSNNATCAPGQLKVPRPPKFGITPPVLKDYVQHQGIFPFNFALESWCWVNCKLNAAFPAQYQASEVKGNDVIFSDSGEWENSNFQRGFLINGQARPHLAIKTGNFFFCNFKFFVLCLFSCHFVFLFYFILFRLILLCCACWCAILFYVSKTVDTTCTRFR